MEGGVIANYGQTSTKPIEFTMSHVVKNIDLKGSTMGSRREFREMVQFVEKHKIKPIVHQVFKGLSVENVLNAASIMRDHAQFGKLVIEINDSNEPKLAQE